MKRVILAVLISASALFLFACGQVAPTSAPPTSAPVPTAAAAKNQAAPTGEPIKVGGTLGLTGGYSGPSAVYKAVYEYWENRVNSTGGLLGRPVKMIIYDDTSTAATAQSLYQRLIKEDKVDLLLAPFSTLVGGGIIPVAEANKMVLWNGGFVGVDLFKKSHWMVGSYTAQEPDYAKGVFELVDSLPADQRPKRVGILTNQGPFPLAVRDGYQGQGGVINMAKQRNMDIVLNEEYAANASDVSGLIQKAKAANVELFFALSTPNDAALIARTANELGFKPKIYCSCGSQVTTLPYWKDLGAAGNGVMANTFAWPTDNYKGVKEITAYLKEKVGYQELSTYATVGLGILEVMEQSVKGAGTLDQQKLLDYVTGRTFDTVNGPIKYDQDRIPAYNAIIVQYVNGSNNVIWPPDRATGKAVIPKP